MAYPRKSAAAPASRQVFIPAPSGANYADPPSSLPGGDCSVLVNLIRGERGLVPRAGYMTQTSAMTGEARTILPFTGTAQDGSGDRLFAADVTGIWDVSTPGAPSLSLSFPAAYGDAGRVSAVAFTTVATKYLVCADEENGLFLYSEAAGTWAAVEQGTDPGQMEGVDPASFAHVCAWKNRLWFTVRDSSVAWILPVGLVAGSGKDKPISFDFGSRFVRGGHLVGLWSWTADGGAGIDDLLVAISSAGDVVVYQGTDPANASSFALRGVWGLGALPAGRRIATDSGGDLLVLTAQGIAPMSRLLSAGEKLDESLYTTRKIAPALSTAMAARRTEEGWALVEDPNDGALLVLTPTSPGTATQAFAMSLTGKGWSIFRGLPALCAAPWRGSLYMGGPDGRVWKSWGHVDTSATDGTTAIPICSSVVTAYGDGGSPVQKRASLIRPEIVHDGNEPTWHAAARFGFDVTEPSEIAHAGGAPGSWGVGLWGTATWGAAAGTSRGVVGATGCGTHLALELSFASVGAFSLVGATVSVDSGGML